MHGDLRGNFLSFYVCKDIKQLPIKFCGNSNAFVIRFAATKTHMIGITAHTRILQCLAILQRSCMYLFTHTV